MATRALLCETVTADTLGALRAARDAATFGDLVELRLDGVRDLDVAGALEGRRGPAVVTCRATWEGGRFEGSEAERRVILTRALELGAEFVDVEWRAGFQELIDLAPARVVVSHHAFDGVPSDLTDRVLAMRSTGAGTIKVAVLTPRLADTRERLAELGPAPAAGQAPEAPDVAGARARLIKQQKALEDNSKRARLLSVEASQLSDSLARRLRGNFSARLWAHDRSAFDLALWGDFAASLPQDLQRARDAVSRGQARRDSLRSHRCFCACECGVFVN